MPLPRGGLTPHSTRAELACLSFAGIESLVRCVRARSIRALDLSVLGKGKMFSVGETLKRYWLRRGIKLNHGVSEDELAAFEAKFHVRLPEDVREYFAAVNGFDGSEHWMTDENVITFLALNEMKPLGEAWSAKVADAASYYVFADYSLSAHVYAIGLSGSSETGNPVVVAYDENPVKVASSFTEFAQGYVEDDNAVLFPEPQV